jgi:hypothetical protein
VREEDGVRAALVTIILCALVNVIDGPRCGECLLYVFRVDGKVSSGSYRYAVRCFGQKPMETQ